MSPSPAFPALGQWMVLWLSNCLSQSCTEYKCCDYRRTVGGLKKDQTSKWLEFEEEGPALPPKVNEHAVTNFYFQLQCNKHVAQALFGEEPLLKSHPFHSHCASKDARYDFREGLPTISNTSPRFMAVGILSRYSPPEVERIWLWVYYNKNPIYAIFYLAKGDYKPPQCTSACSCTALSEIKKNRLSSILKEGWLTPVCHQKRYIPLTPELYSQNCPQPYTFNPGPWSLLSTNLPSALHLWTLHRRLDQGSGRTLSPKTLIHEP